MNLLTLSHDEKQQLVDAFYWYQTIPLGSGLQTRGTVDHAGAFDRYGFPSVAGKTVLDIGTGDGYFAFEFERQGASRVVATELDRWLDDPAFDLPPRTRERRLRKFRTFAGKEPEVARRAQIAKDLGFDRPNPFYLARVLLQSKVELCYQNIYNLARLNEQFDLVFVGTVNVHLQDLPRAFEAVRCVTKHQAVIACADLLDYTAPTGGSWVAFQAIRALRVLGRIGDQVLVSRDQPAALYSANDGGSLWRPSVTCVREMLLSAGFKDVDVYSRFALKNLRHGTQMKHVVFHAFA